MTAATVAQTPVVAEDTRTAGERAIEAAQKPTNNATLLKAVWSTRGEIRAQIAGAEDFGGIQIKKSDLANVLKNLPGDEPANFTLIPTAAGADLVPVAKAE